MNNKQLQIVTFEQAIKLKELGFDWKVNYAYAEKDYIKSKEPIYYVYLKNYNAIDGFISFPSMALALQWFRDVKKINCGITLFLEEDVTTYQYSYIMDNRLFTSLSYNLYPEAEKALLSKIIYYLTNE